MESGKGSPHAVSPKPLLEPKHAGTIRKEEKKQHDQTQPKNGTLGASKRAPCAHYLVNVHVCDPVACSLSFRERENDKKDTQERDRERREKLKEAIG